MLSFSFDSTGFRVNGQDSFMISGEFHYFRVPRADWRRRMRLFREAHGNCLATYVPWIVHEPTEGDIRFGDVDARDLAAFLRTAQEEGLQIVLRPGPYQYSELINDGLPEWLLCTYPEILAKDISGKAFRHSSVSYLHPRFLEKARIYYRAFAEVVRPFMADRGGPVCMLQVDNELTGIHTWFGSLDYNPETMGFGDPEGRYTRWLREKYSDIGSLNAAYAGSYAAFEEVRPIATATPSDAASCRRAKDYQDFYRSTVTEYAVLLTRWLREDGLDGPICHNSPNPNTNCQFAETVSAMGGRFLLGSDHYYTLNANWGQNNPTPQYALRILKSCDTLRALGMPPSVLELPGGSPSDTPPILPEDLLCCYMTNLALGAKGVNYYVFTGGPNFPGTGAGSKIYDYNAHVHADGSLNETYASLKTFGEFMSSHSWMQRGRRVASVQVGFEWNTLRSGMHDYSSLSYGGAKAARLLERGVLYTLMCGKYSPEMVLLTGELDISRPLIIPCPTAMSAAAQEAVTDFIRRGGRALILPVFPDTDTDYQPCRILSGLLGDAQFAYGEPFGPDLCINGSQTVYAGVFAVCEKLPEGARITATDAGSGRVIGFEFPLGEGKLFWFGGCWEMSTFDQAVMMEQFVEMMGGKPCVESSNRNIFTSLWTDDTGRQIVFVMNLYSGRQKTNIRVYAGGEHLWENVELSTMEVKYFEF